MLNEKGRIPCDVRSGIPGDRIVLILWYRGTAGTPIYSFDARGKRVEEGTRWTDEALLGTRAHFHLSHTDTWVTTAKFGAHLELEPTLDRDQAFYRCRVDFKISTTKNTIVNFTVILPPNRPEIYNSSGHVVSGGMKSVSIVGPYNEGDQLILICRVRGGRPSPNIFWVVKDEVWRTEIEEEVGGSLKTTLLIRRLTRHYLHSVFQCQATNFNASSPVTSSVTIDMNFRPANVTILSRTDPMSSYTDYELVCKTWGSRPPATITWLRDGTELLSRAVMTTSSDSNVTTSILRYHSDPIDSGKSLTCRAENKFIPHVYIESSMQLNIHFQPVVTLQMGSSLNPETIKEGDDVYFECHINANPAVNRVLWHHNGSPVDHQVTRGILIQNQTLVLQKVSRSSAGLYTCKAISPQGEGDSLPVRLKVMYKPYCRRQTKTIYGTALHESASVTCEVEALPSSVTFRWTFNNTSEHLPIPTTAVASQGMVSVASYAPKSHLDYGTLLCWAFNDIGEQMIPCAFAIIPAGPPDPPKNCTIINQTTDTIEVQCSAGFDGGLTQVFYMELPFRLSKWKEEFSLEYFMMLSPALIWREEQHLSIRASHPNKHSFSFMRSTIF
ncbi:hypothetical protein SK128_011972 [Halocaridina rubra]|uniref:Ig-like domain-containing protein n=1 Tax=Halocaridina rubra TaxID=373956 RepID=A0AAN9A9A4_HALRR